MNFATHHIINLLMTHLRDIIPAQRNLNIISLTDHTIKIVCSFKCYDESCYSLTRGIEESLEPKANI